MKKLLYIVIIILFIILALKACVRKDVPIVETIKVRPEVKLNAVKFPPTAKTFTIDGVDYLQSQAPLGNFGGALVSSTIGEGPKTFNPFNTKDATSATMAEMMFDGLVTTKPSTGEVIPKLAKSFSISGDGKVYTFKLRRGIQWSDGKPITADDVVFTWNKILLAGLGNTSTRDSVVIDGQLPKVEKIDKYTVKFTTIKPFAPFLRLLSASIAPKHIFEPAVKKGEKYFETFWGTTTPPKNFVVNGAFKLKEYIPAQRIVFERNPLYYEINLRTQRLPYLDKVIYLIVGDLNNEILKFEAHELDVISLRGSNVGRYKQKESKSDYVIYNLGPDTGTMFIAINLNKRKNPQGKYYVAQQKQIWFNDLNFRNAIDWAIDRTSMVNNVANGLGLPLFTSESLNSIYLNKSLANGHPKDLKKAKEYLKKSGFTWKNGILYDKKGIRVEFDLYTNAGNTEREAIGVMVKQDLDDLGMKVNFKPVEFNSLVNKLVNSYDWDFVIMGLTGSPLEPHNGKNVWYSNGSLHLFNQRPADTKVTDKLSWEAQLDKIFDEASLKINFKDRKKLYDQYQQIIYDKKPIVYLYSGIRVIAIRKKFKNIFPSPLSGITYNLDEIYIDNTPPKVKKEALKNEDLIPASEENEQVLEKQKSISPVSDNKKGKVIKQKDNLKIKTEKKIKKVENLQMPQTHEPILKENKSEIQPPSALQAEEPKQESYTQPYYVQPQQQQPETYYPVAPQNYQQEPRQKHFFKFFRRNNSEMKAPVPSENGGTNGSVNNGANQGYGGAVGGTYGGNPQ